MRTPKEIAADLETLETVLKNNAHSMMLAMAQASGATLPADTPDPRLIPQYFVLPDGRKLQLSELAAEVRALG